MRKRSLIVLIGLLLVVACAHTQYNQAMGVAKKVAAVTRDVAKAAPPILSQIQDPHIYNQAAKAYNDFLEVGKEYTESVKIADAVGGVPTLDQITRMSEEVFKFINSLAKMGVNVDKLREIALKLEGGK